jgi:hypothetical protein
MSCDRHPLLALLGCHRSVLIIAGKSCKLCSWVCLLLQFVASGIFNAKMSMQMAHRVRNLTSAIASVVWSKTQFLSELLGSLLLDTAACSLLAVWPVAGGDTSVRRILLLCCLQLKMSEQPSARSRQESWTFCS